MSPAAIFSAGLVVGVFITVLCLFIGLRWSGDRINDPRDEHADFLGADNSFHGERN